MTARPPSRRLYRGLRSGSNGPPTGASAAGTGGPGGVGGSHGTSRSIESIVTYRLSRPAGVRLFSQVADEFGRKGLVRSVTRRIDSLADAVLSRKERRP